MALRVAEEPNLTPVTPDTQTVTTPSCTDRHCSFLHRPSLLLPAQTVTAPPCTDRRYSSLLRPSLLLPAQTVATPPCTDRHCSSLHRPPLLLPAQTATTPSCLELRKGQLSEHLLSYSGLVIGEPYNVFPVPSC
jgi:hypothetical protein